MALSLHANLQSASCDMDDARAVLCWIFSNRSGVRAACLRQAVHELASANSVKEANLLGHEVPKKPAAQATHDPLCCSIEQPAGGWATVSQLQRPLGKRRKGLAICQKEWAVSFRMPLP